MAANNTILIEVIQKLGLLERSDAAWKFAAYDTVRTLFFPGGYAIWLWKGVVGGWGACCLYRGSPGVGCAVGGCSCGENRGAPFRPKGASHELIAIAVATVAG